MIRMGTVLGYAAMTAWLGATAVIVAAPGTPESPYRGIVDRNVFGLKPPPPPDANPAPPEPPTKVSLTGITTILGNKRALLSAQTAGKPAESLMLTEGGEDSGIQVLEIDEVAGTVKVSNHGVKETLDFESNGVKLQTVALPPAGAAAKPPISNLVRPNPMASRTIPPPRVMRTAPANTTATPGRPSAPPTTPQSRVMPSRRPPSR